MPLVEVTRKFEKIWWRGSRLVIRPGSVWARSRRRAISSASEVRQSWEGGTLLFESSIGSSFPLIGGRIFIRKERAWQTFSCRKLYYLQKLRKIFPVAL